MSASQPSLSSSSPVKLALLGGGNFARNTYAPVLERDFKGLVEVSAVWSRSEKGVSEVFDLVSSYAPGVVKEFGDEGLENILDSDQVDAVVVILPPKPALSVTVRALERGKHVLQEKPVGTGSEEIEAALARYEKLGQWRPVWGVAENYRFEEVFAYSRQLIEQSLGSVISINLNAASALNDSSVYWHTPWRHSTDELPAVGGVGVGYLFEGPVHFMAAVRKLVGEVGTSGKVTTSASLQQRNPDLNQLDTVSGWLRFESSTEACTCSFVITKAARVPKTVFLLTCEEGNIEIELLPGKYVLRAQGTDEVLPLLEKEFPFNGVKNEIDCFVKAVCKHKEVFGSTFERKVGFIDQHYPDLSALEAYKDVQCLLAMFKSATSNQVESID